MRKERYFRDELRRLFMEYAIIPAVILTAVCVLILMAVLLYGKSSGSAAQNKQLASQFNPHFLYNTLENIRYMCLIDPQVAQRMVYSLSGLLRYSMDSAQPQVTLGEDLEHLRNYLTILEFRFGRRFSCKQRAVRIGRLVVRLDLSAHIWRGNSGNCIVYITFRSRPHLRCRMCVVCRCFAR